MMQKNLLLPILLLLSGCVSIREWTLPTEGQVDKPPEIVIECIQKVFDEEKIKSSHKLKQRVTRVANGDLIWDTTDMNSVIMKRIVFTKTMLREQSEYRIDSFFGGLYGLGQFEICFK
jgi:hypothetical protein